MNNIYHQSVVKSSVKSKFKGKTELTAKVTPRYPDSPEREFQRLTNKYMKVYNMTLKEFMPELMEAYKNSQRYDSRLDDGGNFFNAVYQVFQKIRERLEERIKSFGLDKFVDKIANLTKNASIREWKRIVRETLGIDIMEDYYKGDFYAQMLQRWVEDSVSYIKSIPNESLSEMQDIVLNSYKQGVHVRSVQKEIQKNFGVSKHKAAMLARDQLSTLNAQITKSQHRDAGVTKYKWSDSDDIRVRDCHRALDGKIFDWNNPPEMWYKTKSRGIVYTGRRCHPGEDYACRCCAIPVFDYDTLDLPIKQKDEG